MQAPRPNLRAQRRFFLAAFCLAALVLLNPPLAPHAAAQGAAHEIILTTGQRDILRQVETHLNGITTLQSTFFQQTSANEFAEGQIYLARPGRLRIEYKPPNEIVLVAKGDHLSYLDKELGQLSHIPVDQTPAAFLLRDRITFDPGEIAFHEVVREDGAIYVTMAERRDPFGARLTLIFRENPMSLRKWSVLDAQGNITDVVLTDPFFGGELDEALFEVEAPEEQRGGD